MDLRPLLPRILELRSGSVHVGQGQIVPDTEIIEERAMVALRAGVRKLAVDTLIFRKTIPVTLQPLFEQPIVDSSLLGADPAYDIIQVLRVESVNPNLTHGYKVLLPRNKRELKDRYARWPIPSSGPTMWADEMGSLMTLPISPVPFDVLVDIVYSPRGERYESVDGITSACEEAIVCWASAEILMIGGPGKDPVRAKEFRLRYLCEQANIRGAVELGSSDRYVLKNEPTARWPWTPGGFPSWS